MLTPARAKLADKLGEVTSAAVPVFSVLYVIDHSSSGIALVAAGATYFLHPLFEKAWREALKRKVDMVVTADQFRFRRFSGWIAFDRALPHNFSLKPHDLTRKERDEHELKMLKAQQRRKVVQPRRYYQDSYHFFYELLRQRNDITEIFGQPDAQAVLTRLRAIDEVINARAKRGDGTALKPGDQWVEQPGAIPEGAGR